jgi:hypothetical protein
MKEGRYKLSFCIVQRELELEYFAASTNPQRSCKSDIFHPGPGFSTPQIGRSESAS